ncbi:MAG: thiol:disulfide interchange protein DsbG [Burkholderiales bacterium]|nr:thiol:disulfide interchange protein DsbG [Burkholderiales bacterium]
MTAHLPSLFQRPVRIAGLLGLGAVLAAPALSQPRPPVLTSIEAHGVTIVGQLPAPAGMTAFAGFRGQQPLALYVTPDGQQVIVGTLLDAQGRDQTREALHRAVAGPMADAAWRELAASRWLADGRDGARVVYVFTDPNCPYCNQLWSAARPWVAAGKLQLRHVIVGILTPTSAGKAAALLAARDPAALLAAYEARNAAATARAIAGGHPRPLSDAGLQPLPSIPPARQAELDANARLMEQFGLQATPALVWRGADGALQLSQGMPEGGLGAVLGPP